MSSGIVSVDDRHLEVEALGPLGALGLAETPGVALVLDVAEHEPGLGGEARTPSAPHSAACRRSRPRARCRPGTPRRRRRRSCTTRARRARWCSGTRVSGSPCRRRPRSWPAAVEAWREHVVAQAHDDQLRRERLAGVPGRAHRLAAPALGAGGEVEHLLPGEVLDLADPEDRVFGRRSPCPCRASCRAHRGRGAGGRWPR